MYFKNTTSIKLVQLVRIRTSIFISLYRVFNLTQVKFSKQQYIKFFNDTELGPIANMDKTGIQIIGLSIRLCILYSLFVV